MSKCSICDETLGLAFSMFLGGNIRWCGKCKEKIGLKIIAIADGSSAKHEDGGFLTTSKTWMLHPDVVDRLVEVGRPLSVKFLKQPECRCYLVYQVSPADGVIEVEDPYSGRVFDTSLSATLVAFERGDGIVCDHHLAGGEEQSIDRDKYPHDCPYCGKPAYISGCNTLDCTGGCQC